MRGIEGHSDRLAGPGSQVQSPSQRPAGQVQRPGSQVQGASGQPAQTQGPAFEALLQALRLQMQSAAIGADGSDGSDGSGQAGADSNLILGLAGLGNSGSDWTSILLQQQLLKSLSAAGGKSEAADLLGAMGLTGAGGVFGAGGIPAARAAGAAASPQPVSGSRQERFEALKPMFQQAERETGVPWQIQAAQWALETGWGRSTPRDLYTGQESYNLFGIKGEGPAGSVASRTLEYENGRLAQQVARFRAYHSPQESVTDHARMLTTPYYARAHAAGQDLQAWTEALGPRGLGYATDPEYSDKLWQIIQENGWHQQ